MHALGKRALDLCRKDGDVLVLDDAAVSALADGWSDVVDRGDAFAGAEALLAAALVLLETPEGKPAAKTLLSLVLAAQPALAKRDADRAARLKEKADGAAAAFKAFSDDDTAKKGVLDSGARPAGTTAAGPLARFALVGQAPPKKPKDTP